MHENGAYNATSCHVSVGDSNDVVPRACNWGLIEWWLLITLVCYSTRNHLSYLPMNFHRRASIFSASGINASISFNDVNVPTNCCSHSMQKSTQSRPSLNMLMVRHTVHAVNNYWGWLIVRIGFWIAFLLSQQHPFYVACDDNNIAVIATWICRSLEENRGRVSCSTGSPASARVSQTSASRRLSNSIRSLSPLRAPETVDRTNSRRDAWDVRTRSYCPSSMDVT